MRSAQHPSLLAHRVPAGDAGALRRLLERMELAGVAPSTVTFNILVDGYARGGRLDEARATMEGAAARGTRLDAWTYSSLVGGRAGGGGWRGPGGQRCPAWRGWQGGLGVSTVGAKGSRADCHRGRPRMGSEAAW